METGSKDGTTTADNDTPYTFGRTPHVAAPFPFTPRQFAHLLIVRGRAQDGDYSQDGRYASTAYAHAE